MITLSEGRSKFISNEKFQEVLEWVKSAGVDRRSDQESTSCILFHRGWRADKLYLLDGADVHCLSHLNKSVRMSVLEKSEWERDSTGRSASKSRSA
ncbi:tuzin [Trypanosoma cruzi]|uniref:Tuzin n=1 Tax=Trypanosoma cruzi TaxID=5693 RepID=A0A2V2VGX3_TRYCR|nr:tuzin [Trypanosoma cruzi]